MRPQQALPFMFIFLAGCAGSGSDAGSTESGTETVLITYHVIAGKERDLLELLGKVWEIYRKEDLVLAQPHVVVRDKETGDKVRFIEIFTWVSPDAPDHAPDSVKKVWDQMQACC